MKICAIILNYRNAARTEACVCSLNGEGLDTVLIVDNSADERAADELAAMIGRQAVLVDYHMARAHVLLAMKTRCHPPKIPLLLASNGVSLGLCALWRRLYFGNAVPLKTFFMAWSARDIRVP